MNLRTVAALLAMVALPAAAQAPSTPRVDKRQAKQEARIEQGVQSGQVTAKESAKLEKGQDKVEKMESKATADGKLTAKERAKIEHAQDKQSKKIYKQKHDKQKQAPAT